MYDLLIKKCSQFSFWGLRNVVNSQKSIAICFHSQSITGSSQYLTQNEATNSKSLALQGF